MCSSVAISYQAASSTSGDQPASDTVAMDQDANSPPMRPSEWARARASSHSVVHTPVPTAFAP
eukprot:15211852-Heterocapsa_arctica.AAC.1